MDLLEFEGKVVSFSEDALADPVRFPGDKIVSFAVLLACPVRWCLLEFEADLVSFARDVLLTPEDAVRFAGNELVLFAASDKVEFADVSFDLLLEFKGEYGLSIEEFMEAFNDVELSGGLVDFVAFLWAV